MADQAITVGSVALRRQRPWKRWSGVALVAVSLGWWIVGDSPISWAQTARQPTDSTASVKPPKSSDRSSASNRSAKEKAEASAAAKAKSPKALPGITPAREAAVMTFVKHHHAELAELLVHLKENAPKEYDRAVRDLFRTSERLAQLQERDSETYELELKLWKTHSRAQLIAARLQMSNTEELRRQLRSTLDEEYDIRLELLQRDRERAAERLKNVEEQIRKLSQRRKDEIEKQIRQLTSVGGSDTKAKTSKKKPEPKPKAEK